MLNLQQPQDAFKGSKEIQRWQFNLHTANQPITILVGSSASTVEVRATWPTTTTRAMTCEGQIKGLPGALGGMTPVLL